MNVQWKMEPDRVVCFCGKFLRVALHFIGTGSSSVQHNESRLILKCTADSYELPLVALSKHSYTLHIMTLTEQSIRLAVRHQQQLSFIAVDVIDFSSHLLALLNKN